MTRKRCLTGDVFEDARNDALDRAKGRQAMELAAISGWLEGFSPAVWLIPTDKVSDEQLAEYDAKVARLKELVMEGGAR